MQIELGTGRRIVAADQRDNMLDEFIETKIQKSLILKCDGHLGLQRYTMLYSGFGWFWASEIMRNWMIVAGKLRASCVDMDR